ncbi:MAG: tRNA (adenosine(37)-N6)-dimethylallyltransferase MiaA [Prevotellaceae bacterium]|jgi:tRNA dimethylallyltransferase|nr:tRNA (adenosine(37)-N6)-dimethylallyltransferase MiaA [Prevotellaceae bacterium]
MPEKEELISILGATATGKTKIAVALANDLNGEILSADSRQVYRKMDAGTGKDIEDYTVSGKKIPYHLIDIVDVGYKYNVFEYQRDFYKTYNDVCSRNRQPILCGGSGMYIEAVVNGYNMPEAPANYKLRAEFEKHSDDELINILASLKHLHNKTDYDSRKRLIRAIEIETFRKENDIKISKYEKLNNIYFGIIFDTVTRRKRITERLDYRLKNGMIDEVKHLLENDISADDLIYYGLEYKFITLYLVGKLNYDEMRQQLNIAIHRFAKRQMTWFRGMERRGAKINWIDGHLPIAEKIKQIKNIWNCSKSTNVNV